jgi:hypothetical protein
MNHTRKSGMNPSKNTSQKLSKNTSQKLSKNTAVFTPKKLSKNAPTFVPANRPINMPLETIKRIVTISKDILLTQDDWIEINDHIPFDTTIEFTDNNDIVILFNAYQRPGNPMSIEGHISGLHITKHPGGSINRKGALHLKLTFNHNGIYHNIYYRIYLFGTDEEKLVLSRNLLQLGELYIDMESDFELRKLPPPIIQELSRFIYPFVSSFGEAFTHVY